MQIWLGGLHGCNDWAGRTGSLGFSGGLLWTGRTGRRADAAEYGSLDGSDWADGADWRIGGLADATDYGILNGANCGKRGGLGQAGRTRAGGAD